MSVSNATVEIAFKARNLAEAAVNDLKSGLSGIGTTGVNAAKKVGGAFSSLGGALANGLGNATETLASGGGLIEASAGLGIYMAGQLVEQFAGGLLEKLAGSTLLATITAPLTAIGTAAGGLISAAVPIGMAALPVLLVAAIAGVIAVLIANPEIRGKVIGFVQGLAGTIVNGIKTFLGVLPQVVGTVFKAAWELVLTGVKTYIKIMTTLWLDIPKALIGLGASILRTIINGLAGLPNAVSKAIGDAFRSLKVDIGPFHIRGGGITVDFPKIDVPNIGIPGLATGVKGFGGGLAMVGERGPELVRLPRGSDVIPTDQLRGSGGFGGVGLRVVGVSQRELTEIVERGLMVRLERAAPTTGRGG